MILKHEFLTGQITAALDDAGRVINSSTLEFRREALGDLPGPFAVSALADAVIGVAGREMAEILGVSQVSIDHLLASRWFDMTLRPQGWQIPAPWDALAGDYETADGWIKLHTNAPHHRRAALLALGLDPIAPHEKASVAARVHELSGEELEARVIAEGGASAVMRSARDWRAHPQGQAIAQEQLIAWQARAPVVPQDTPRAALKGLKVLDLTRVLAGPVATRFLAGFGAQVLRIDPPDWSEPGVVPEVTLGKRCAGLDLTHPADRTRFEALLSKADVLVHGYRPGALAGLGYDHAQRQALNPGLIDVSLCAYGWTGPWAARRGFDSLVQMSCGIAQTGMEAHDAPKPHSLPVQALDHATGYLMAAAVLRALRLRDQGGLVLSARLSLARTALLLMSAEGTPIDASLPPESTADLRAVVEETDWGSAHRLCPPVEIDGNRPIWGLPAGELRRHAAQWSD